MSQSNEIWQEELWNKIVNKVSRTSQRIGNTFPYVSIDGKYDAQPAHWWTSGFWPGLLWLVYRETQDERLKEIAISCEEQMDTPLLGFDELHHDVGFMWSLTAVAQYKLLLSAQSKRRGLIAASHLVGRFNVKGNFIRAWNGADQQGWAIIDCLMNLPLLYWASETTNDPRFKHIAKLHADMALREFIRPDGSAHHIVCFDPETGARLEARGGQGYSPDSAWARGTTWALYGMALSYRYTRDEAYLQAAKKVAHFFLANLPDDGVPFWDFRAPLQADMAMDSTSSAIAASGLIELSRLVPEAEQKLYFHAGERILRLLDENYSAWDEDEEGLLLKGTANFPKNTYVNIPHIYGDYFFAEAVAKLRGQRELFW